MNARLEKLLTVTGLFEIPGRGVMLEPWIPFAAFGNRKLEMFVLLRRPDATEERVLARFSMPHVPHPDRMCFACLLPRMKTEDVPVGSEICSFVEDEAKA